MRGCRWGGSSGPDTRTPPPSCPVAGWPVLLLVWAEPPLSRGTHVPPLVVDTPCLPPTARLPHGHHSAEGPYTRLTAAHQGQLLLSTHVGPGTERGQSVSTLATHSQQAPASCTPVLGVQPSRAGSRPEARPHGSVQAHVHPGLKGTRARRKREGDHRAASEHPPHMGCAAHMTP